MIIFGIIIFCGVNSDAIDYFLGSNDFWNVDSDRASSETVYTIDTFQIWNSYAEDDEGVYYIISGQKNDEMALMGMYVPSAREAEADKVMDAWYSYLELDEEEYTGPVFHGGGVVYGMSDTEAQFFEKALVEKGADEDTLAVAIPYNFAIFTNGYVLKYMFLDNFLATIMTALFLIVGFILLSGFFNGAYKKNLMTALENNGLDEDAVAKDLDLSNSKNRPDKFPKHVILGNQYMMTKELNSNLLILDQLVWCYQKTTNSKHRVYGFIPAGTTTSYSVVFVDDKKRVMETSVKSEAAAQALIDELQKYAPAAIYGYTEEIAAASQQNYAQLVEAVQERKQKLF